MDPHNPDNWTDEEKNRFIDWFLKELAEYEHLQKKCPWELEQIDSIEHLVLKELLYKN